MEMQSVEAVSVVSMVRRIMLRVAVVVLTCYRALGWQQYAPQWWVNYDGRRRTPSAYRRRRPFFRALKSVKDVPSSLSRVEVKEETKLMALKKKELVELCRSAGLKVSGTKAELVERLVGANCSDGRIEEVGEAASVPEVSARPSGSVSVDAEVEIGAFVDEIAGATNVDPEKLASKSSLLLVEDGEVFDRVCQQRLLRSPNDASLKGAIALLRGYVSAELKLQARDTVRYVLRIAIEAPHDMDRCFKMLSDAGKLNAALLAYVDELLSQQQHAAQRDSASLLSKVLIIVKDRIEAERHVAHSEELRTLAEAIRFKDPTQRRDYLQSALASSLDFAQRFESYVREATSYVDQNKVSTQLDADAIRNVYVLVTEIRAKMPV